MIVIPTLEEKTFEGVRGRIEKIRDTSRWIQVDVFDGVFSYGKSFELEQLTKLERNEGFLWEVHLMVKEPIKWIEKCLFVGASRVVGQVEMMSNRKAFVEQAKDSGLEVGLAYDSGTKIDKIPDEIDLVLLMSRKAGFEEMPIDTNIFDRIKLTKALSSKRERGFLVGVDGGVTEANYQAFEKVGADVVYCGSHYFEVHDAINQ